MKLINNIVLLLVPMLSFSQVTTEPKTFKQIIQSGINDYFIPILILLFLMGAGFGVAKNWTKINDTENEGRRKEGFAQIGMICLYTFLAVAAIGIVLGAVKNLTITI